MKNKTDKTDIVGIRGQKNSMLTFSLKYKLKNITVFKKPKRDFTILINPLIWKKPNKLTK